MNAALASCSQRMASSVTIAGLREDDKAFDPARRLGEAPGAALPADPVADG